MKWVGVANARTLKCGGIIFPQRGSVHRSVHRSSVFLFFGLRPIRLSWCLPHLVQAGRAFPRKFIFADCRILILLPHLSLFVFKSNQKFSWAIVDLAPWNFQCGILTLEFRALSPKPATANLNPKKFEKKKKKKKPSLESCCGAPHKTRERRDSGARGPGGTRAHRPTTREVHLDPTPLGGTVL